MIRRIKNVIITCENGEVIEIDGKYIGEMYCEKIKERFHRIAVNAFDHYKECGEFFIEIHKDASKFFDRLARYYDICDVEIMYTDEDYHVQTVQYQLKWESGDGAINNRQFAYISKKGHLYIRVGKGSLWDKYSKVDLDTRDWPWIDV